MSWMERKANQYQRTGQAWEPSEQEVKNLQKMFGAVKEAGKTAVASGLTGIFSGMGGLGMILQFIGEIFSALEPVMDLASAFIKIAAAGYIEAIMPAIEAFIPILTQLSPLIYFVGYALGWLARVGLLPLVLTIWAVGAAITSIIDWITGLLWLFTAGRIQKTAYLAEWNKFMAPMIAGVLGVPSYQAGIPYVPRMGMAMLHEGETVKSREQRLAELRNNWMMERMAMGIEKLVSYKEGMY